MVSATDLTADSNDSPTNTTTPQPIDEERAQTALGIRWSYEASLPQSSQPPLIIIDKDPAGGGTLTELWENTEIFLAMRQKFQGVPSFEGKSLSEIKEIVEELQWFDSYDTTTVEFGKPTKVTSTWSQYEDMMKDLAVSREVAQRRGDMRTVDLSRLLGAVAQESTSDKT